jgi:murein DD-endopeptidase MepM/ murein hydrolase activator NlpD
LKQAPDAQPVPRPQPGAHRSWTLLVVPDGGRGPVSQFSIRTSQLSALKWALGALAALVVFAVGAPFVLWPRLSGYEGIAAENFTLRARLATIDHKMEDVDDAIRRIRLYDSQLKQLSLAGNLPGTGPLDEEDEAELNRLLGVDRLATNDAAAWRDPDGVPVDDLPGGDVTVGDIRPVELWAMGVEARVTRIVGMVSEMEPRMSTLVQDLEDWRSVQSSLPTIWPVDGILSSEFGYRSSPFGRHHWKFHTGLDIAAPRGTPVVAPAAGVVTYAGYFAGYGRTIEIDHGHGIRSRFAHNTQIFFAEGDAVEKGQIISTVGSTGRTTGPHLHYELFIHGHQVDPLDYLP